MLQAVRFGEAMQWDLPCSSAMHRFIVVQFITTVLLFVMGGAFPVWA